MNKESSSSRVSSILVTGFYVAISLVVLVGGYLWYESKRAPVQPIAFSHNIHASELGLACNFCHIYAEKSRRAGVPSVQKCMSCHRVVATDRPEIKKLRKYWDEKEPIPWVRVHSLPQHVYFTHKRHIKARVECTECHGFVQTMDVVRKVSSLKMGWCVSCHRTNNAPTDCLTCHK